MSVYEKKAWIDSISEYPTRRKLTNVNTSEERIVDVSRQEGTVSVAGSPFNATTMNDLETRVDNVVTECEDNFQSAIDRIYQICVNNGITPLAATPQAIASAIAQIRSDGNATAEQILKDKIAIVDKSIITGTMTNRGAWTAASPSSSGNVTIPAGYHNGNGYVNGGNAWQAGRTQGKADKKAHTLIIDGIFTSKTKVTYNVYYDNVLIAQNQDCDQIGGSYISAAFNFTNGLADLTYSTDI